MAKDRDAAMAQAKVIMELQHMRRVIGPFNGTYAFLSNFYSTPHAPWQTAEHGYQAAKSMYLSVREEVLRADTPGAAKRMGQRLEMRFDWRDVRYDEMYRIVLEKFKSDPALAAKLVETGDALLAEINYWRDGFWGIDCWGTIEAKTSVGKNHLGCILMIVRDKLRY